MNNTTNSAIITRQCQKWHKTGHRTLRYAVRVLEIFLENWILKNDQNSNMYNQADLLNKKWSNCVFLNFNFVKSVFLGAKGVRVCVCVGVGRGNVCGVGIPCSVIHCTSCVCYVKWKVLSCFATSM